LNTPLPPTKSGGKVHRAAVAISETAVLKPAGNAMGANTMFPADSVGYRRGNTLHIRDTSGHHWTIQAHPKSGAPYSRPFPKASSKYYGRPKGQSGISDALVGISHGLMNMVSQEGAWAWYTGFGDIKTTDVHEVEHGYVPKRNHTANMNLATLAELGSVHTATEYARAGHGAFFTRGHSGIRYEWCHLISHGLRGSDAPENIVAATAFQNTEQLVLENTLYEYRMEGLQVRVQAKLASGTRHLAESIYYKVMLENDAVAYTRTMDARRATNPAYGELAAIAQDMRDAINTALAYHYPATGFPPDIIDYFEIDEVYPG
jgi:hypothetical protein